MATYTLTFSSDVDVTVDGVTVTSPYTLTKSCTINVSTMVNPNRNYYISMNGMEVLSETVNFTDEDLDIHANTSSTGRTLELNAVVNFTISAAPKVSIDVTTLSGYESLAAGTYALGVKSKAANYQDSDLSTTVSFTKLAAPVATAADTTVTWDAVTNADSYDVYVDGELYENTTGGYDITTTVTNGTYSGDTTITDTATITITADSGYKLPDTVTVTGASHTWNKETGTLTLSNPTGAVTVSAVCEAVQTGYNITITSKNVYPGSGYTIGYIAINRQVSKTDWDYKFTASNDRLTHNTGEGSEEDVTLPITIANVLNLSALNAGDSASWFVLDGGASYIFNIYPSDGVTTVNINQDYSNCELFGSNSD